MTDSPLFEIGLFVMMFAAIGTVLWYSLRQKNRDEGETHYVRALEALAEGDEVQAVAQFKAAARENSSNYRIYLLLGDLLRRQGMREQALKLHSDLTLREGLAAEAQLKVLRSLRRDYEALEDAQKGAGIAGKLVSLQNRPDSDALQQWVALLEKISDWEKVAEVVAKYRMKFRFNVDRRLALYAVFRGMQLGEKGKGADARAQFAAALKSDPGCSAAYYHLGKAWLAEGNPGEALAAWRRLCESRPEQAWLVLPELAKLPPNDGLEEARNDLIRQLAGQKQAGSKTILALATWLAEQAKDPDGALALLEQQEKIAPAPEIYRAKFRLLMRKRKYRLAAEQYQGLLDQEAAGPGAPFVCNGCNQTFDQPLWQCPGCRQVDTFGL